MRGNKKAAIEMSIGTIVTIVLAMSMLILGMVLVKNIFSGYCYTETLEKTLKVWQTLKVWYKTLVQNFFWQLYFKKRQSIL